MPDMHARLLAAHPQIFVTDFPRAIAFYETTLGFQVVYAYGSPPFYGLVTRDGAGLNLRHVDHPVMDAGRRDREWLLSANIPAEAVEALFEEFDRRDVVFAQRLAPKPWGTRDFVVRDPDGNLICFAESAT